MRTCLRVAFCLLSLIVTSRYAYGQSGILTTYAGRPIAMDGGLANSQALKGPTGIVSDRAGGFYVSSYILNRVYRVTAGGVMSLVAGTGIAGFSGDGGPATAAQINTPAKLAIDAGGNLYIADAGNSRIRRVTPAGVISTVAGNGLFGYNGDGGPATSAALAGPTGVDVDAGGNLYIADFWVNVVRKVTPGGIITTVAGNATGGYSGDGGSAILAQLAAPYAVAVDGAGNIFIADNANRRIRKVTPGGIISTAVGTGAVGFSGDGGLATAAQINSPADVEVDGGGNLYIADTFNQRVRVVTPSGIINTVAGNGTTGPLGDGGAATAAQLNNPVALATDSANSLLIADLDNDRVRKVASGIITTAAGVTLVGFGGDNGPANQASFNIPASLAVDASGNLYIADSGNNRVRKVTPAGVISTLAGDGVAGFLGDGQPAISARLDNPSGVAVDANGNVFIADHLNNRVRKVSTNGIITTVAGSGATGFSGDGGPATAAAVHGPVDVAVDGAGNLYISTDDGPGGISSRIRRVTPGGTISTVAGTATAGFSGDNGPATAASINRPQGIAIDAEGNLFIADMQNSRIRRVGANGIITTVAGDGTPSFRGDGGPAKTAWVFQPLDVAVDSAGNLFIADGFNSRIRRVTRSGLITTVAGGVLGYSVDGLPATSSALLDPHTVAVDTNFNLYIGEVHAPRIRKVSSRAKGDFNGDGRSDVLWRDPSGNVSMWQLRGYTIVSDTPVASIWTGWAILGTGDFDADGKSDILWRDPGGTVVVWLMSGSTVTNYGIAGALPLSWTVAAVADFNADGRADILWRENGGDVAVWLMNGATTTTTAFVGNIWTGWKTVGAADFNGDGRADVLWRDPSGDVAIWLMNGTTVLTGTVVGNIWTGWIIVGTGDFNGDGRGDILWRDPSGDVAVWLMNGASAPNGTVIGNIWLGWTIAGVGDYNGDGLADILWREVSSSVAIWTMDSTTISSYALMPSVSTRLAQ